MTAWFGVATLSYESMTDSSEKQFALPVRALPGTHERVVNTALRYVPAGSTALDLGASSGGLTERLLSAGFRVTAADVGSAFAPKDGLHQSGLQRSNFRSSCGVPIRLDRVGGSDRAPGKSYGVPAEHCAAIENERCGDF